MTVYLLHLDTPLSHAKHYMGSCDDLDARLERHRAGNGARLLAVCVERGISWKLARTWPGNRQLERKLKNCKNTPRLCPICSEKAMGRGNYNQSTKEEFQNEPINSNTENRQRQDS